MVETSFGVPVRRGGLARLCDMCSGVKCSTSSFVSLRIVTIDKAVHESRCLFSLESIKVDSTLVISSALMVVLFWKLASGRLLCFL